MKKYITCLYSLLIIAVLVSIFFIGRHQDNVVVDSRYERDYTVVRHYHLEQLKDENTPCGVKFVYSWELDEVSPNGEICTFYASHENVYFYLEEELVGKFECDFQSRMGSTTYSDWAKVFLTEEDSYKTLSIVIVPLYSTSLRPTTFYYGDHYMIMEKIIIDHLPLLVIGIALVVIGIGFLIFGIVNQKNYAKDSGIIWLGIFAILIGLWKLTDMQSAMLIFKNAQVPGYMTLVILSLVVVPYISFIRRQFLLKNDLIWNLISIFSILQSVVILGLQFAGILDLRESLLSTHVVIVVCIFTIIGLIYKESLHTKWNTKLTITIICSLLCLVGACIDLLLYYLKGDSGTVIFCILAFLIYVVCMGCVTIKETKTLMKWGVEAKHYQEIAMHDGLTELYSRSFYNDYLTRHNFNRSDCAIIMFDMNHLKKSNDTYGHAFGDQRLKDFSKILWDVFSQVGKVCRFGGDEFCVLIKTRPMEEWIDCLNAYEEKIKEYNEVAQCEIPLEAAYGYAIFDENEDGEFSNTVRRADKMMYEKKVHMKLKRKEELL